MDISQAQDLVGWIIGLFASSFIAIAIGIINIVKSGKMLPREVKGADLDNDEKNLTNEEKRLGLAASYKAIAKQAADEALETNKRLCILEDKVNDQENVIKGQASIIEEQSKRLDLQDIKIKEQEEEIGVLRCELSNARTYNEALIQQMKNSQIIPIDVSMVSQKNCENIRENKGKGRKNGNKME